MTTVRVTFDGRVFVPQGAVNLPVGSVWEIPLDPSAEQSADGLEEQFQQLADEWQRAVAHQSSSRIRYEHPACQAIVRLGPPVAPLALLGMKKHLNRIARGTLDADDLQRDIAAAQESGDLREGRDAWAQKRKPAFTGR